MKKNSCTGICRRNALLNEIFNPFNPSTTIGYSIRELAFVQLDIYDQLGRLVRRLVHEKQLAGEYFVTWDGRDGHGRLVASGPYFYSLKAGERTIIAKKNAVAQMTN